MRNNSVGNRPEAIVQSIASKICVMVGHYSPQTHLILVLKRDALGLSLLLHHGGTLLACLAKNSRQKNAGSRQINRLVVWEACLRDLGRKRKWFACDELITYYRKKNGAEEDSGKGRVPLLRSATLYTGVL